MNIFFLIAITAAGFGQPVIACVFCVAAIAVSQRHRLKI